MPVCFDELKIGSSYDRPELARLWGLGGFQALGRGVYTPRGTRLIVLFVTCAKQQCLTQYNDFLKDDLLFWEGEDGHGNDERIANASQAGDKIHLFYRERHHSPFVYHGRVILTHWVRHSAKPSEFVFKVISLVPAILPEYSETLSVVDEVAEVQQADEAVCEIAMSEAGLNSIDKEVVAKSRGIGQRYFRGGLLKLWTGECAVTGTRNPDVLRASHIKPWKSSNLTEKVDPFNGLLLIPNIDTLLDTGLVSFAETGQILISPKLEERDRQHLNIHRELHLRFVPPQSQLYLQFHRDNRFRA